jgi:spore coat polysaccharide biosynthesis predicted glycosyltransferase SpsG
VDADVAVIDSYVADIDVYRTVAETASAAVYLDDTARLPYPKGIVVNGNPEATSLGFTAGPETTLLLGVEYQLLRSEFTDASHHEVNPSVTRILVISGGSDAGNVRDALATIASSACQNAIVDVVRESRTASELRDAMLAADIALTAAGQTIYELAATGTPTIAVCVADNQIAQARAFERAGALAYAGEWGDRGVDERVAFLLGTLDPLDTREAMSLAGRALVDGTGARLVAKTCIEIAAMKTGDKGGA